MVQIFKPGERVRVTVIVNKQLNREGTVRQVTPKGARVWIRFDDRTVMWFPATSVERIDGYEWMCNTYKTNNDVPLRTFKAKELSDA